MFALFLSIDDGVDGCKIQLLCLYRMYLMLLLFESIPLENGCNRYQGILYLLGQLPKKVSMLRYYIIKTEEMYFTTNTDQNITKSCLHSSIFLFW